MSTPHSCRPVAPKGNLNAIKLGFYNRRFKKRDLTGVENTDIIGLIEEIALIRVFTHRFVESYLADADPYTLSDILRILCLASSTITRLTRTQYLLNNSGTSMDDDIAETVRQVNLELGNNQVSSTLDPDRSLPFVSPSDLP